VEIVLLVNLSLDLALNTQADDVGIAFTRDSTRVGIDHSQRFLELRYTFSCILFLPLDVVLEIARERLDLLDLLSEICSKAAELIDDISLDVSCLVGLGNGLLVEVAENAVSIIQASFKKKCRGHIRVVDDIGHFEK
jgi:hypothetical protein